MNATNGALLDQIRAAIDTASREGRPAPGRGALVEATGATDHAVRKALAELAATQRAGDDNPRTRTSTFVFVLGALVGLVVSADTSWRFFRDMLGVSNVPERIAMFAGMEILLIACGISMFEGVRRRGGTPGPARWLAWAICGASAYAAFVLSVSTARENWFWHGFRDLTGLVQSVSRTRLRSRSGLARPNIWRLSILSRLTWPSTGPLFQGRVSPAVTAPWSRRRPTTKERSAG